MHGLICRAIEGFVKTQHGMEAWAAIRASAALPFDGFEALRIYDRDLVEAVLDGTAEAIGSDRDALFEDVGHWVCTHPPLESVRRLFRFTGATFLDLVYALDEVHDRACMAVPGLDLPHYRLKQAGPEEFRIASRWSIAGGAALLTGALRAMADDYGTLALIDATGARQVDGRWLEEIELRVVLHDYQKPREFTFGGVT